MRALVEAPLPWQLAKMAAPSGGKGPERLGLMETPESWSVEQKTNVDGHQVSSALEGSLSVC